jgi:hypothetical protein
LALLYNQLNSESVEAATELEAIIQVQADLTELIEQTTSDGAIACPDASSDPSVDVLPGKLLMMG